MSNQINPHFDTVLFNKLLERWQEHKHLISPPSSPLCLWESATREIWIANDWGPSVPYGPRNHGDGHKNHGYKPLKGNVDVIRHLPEVDGWPELEQFLVTINAANSPIESAGCEKGYFPAEVDGEPRVKLGSYVDVFFTAAALNDNPENLLMLASCLILAVEGCEQWWAFVEISLTRFRFIAGAANPWGLMLRITNYGRTEEEARALWGETLRRLGDEIVKLPKEL